MYIVYCYTFLYFNFIICSFLITILITYAEKTNIS